MTDAIGPLWVKSYSFGEHAARPLWVDSVEKVRVSMGQKIFILVGAF
jgi:hypothetical protein